MTFRKGDPFGVLITMCAGSGSKIQVQDDQ